MLVTLLGTGTPIPSADRFGSAILVDVGGQLWLFDCGRGAIIRLQQVQAGAASRVRDVFLTHLHSDHVVGLPDLWLTGWILGRGAALRVWGPEGTETLVSHLAQAYRADVTTRQRPPENLPAAGAELWSRLVRPGLVYEEGGVRITSFPVDHGHVTPALGYRVEHGARSVVISGDTKYCETLIDAALGADVLLHTAWLPDSRNTAPVEQRSIASAEEAGRVFSRVRPRLAVAYHYLAETDLEAGVRTFYDGPFVIARDRLAIDVGETITWRQSE